METMLMENRCIYYTDPGRKLSYERQEHIIPAGIGGIRKLPKGYVSDQFNNDISKVELGFMRHSIISLPRQIIGPGSRGKQGIKYATKSPIHLLENTDKPGNYDLGYIQLGKPIIIPQIKINLRTGELTCSVPNEYNEQNALDLILSALDHFDEGNLSRTKSDYPIEGYVFLGFYEKTYLTKSENDIFTLDQRVIEMIASSLKQTASPQQQDKNYIKTNQTAILDEGFYRIAAKTAFNTLAWLKGNDYLQHNCFDPIRDYIVKGGPPGLSYSIEKREPALVFPEDAHWVLISTVEGGLFANVCFYNSFLIQVVLATQLEIPLDLTGFVCDWKERREWLLNDYILNLNEISIVKKGL